MPLNFEFSSSGFSPEPSGCLLRSLVTQRLRRRGMFVRVEAASPSVMTDDLSIRWRSVVLAAAADASSSEHKESNQCKSEK